MTRAARDRLHLGGTSITQLAKSTVRSGSLLGNKRYLPLVLLQTKMLDRTLFEWTFGAVLALNTFAEKLAQNGYLS